MTSGDSETLIVGTSRQLRQASPAVTVADVGLLGLAYHVWLNRWCWQHYPDRDRVLEH